MASQQFLKSGPETQKYNNHILPADIANLTSDNNQLSDSLSNVTSGPKMPNTQTGKQQVKNVIQGGVVGVAGVGDNDSQLDQSMKCLQEQILRSKEPLEGGRKIQRQNSAPREMEKDTEKGGINTVQSFACATSDN